MSKVFWGLQIGESSVDVDEISIDNTIIYIYMSNNNEQWGLSGRLLMRTSIHSMAGEKVPFFMQYILYWYLVYDRTLLTFMSWEN